MKYQPLKSDEDVLSDSSTNTKVMERAQRTWSRLLFLLSCFLNIALLSFVMIRTRESSSEISDYGSPLCWFFKPRSQHAK